MDSRDYGLVGLCHQFVLQNVADRLRLTLGARCRALSVLSLDDLEKRRPPCARAANVVLCHGTFDLMHAGHIRHLRRARQEGDVLMVTLTGDAHVGKGPGRPVFREDLRAETLAALESVDFVAINHEAAAITPSRGCGRTSTPRAAITERGGRRHWQYRREQQAAEARGRIFLHR